MKNDYKIDMDISHWILIKNTLQSLITKYVNEDKLSDKEKDILGKVNKLVIDIQNRHHIPEEFQIYTYKEGQTLQERLIGAYWQRNVLALLLANTFKMTSGYFEDKNNLPDNWSRVISLFDGKANFIIPDSFIIGHLPKIKVVEGYNKYHEIMSWRYLLQKCGITKGMLNKNENNRN